MALRPVFSDPCVIRLARMGRYASALVSAKAFAPPMPPATSTPCANAHRVGSSRSAKPANYWFSAQGAGPGRSRKNLHRSTGV